MREIDEASGAIFLRKFGFTFDAIRKLTQQYIQRMVPSGGCTKLVRHLRVLAVVVVNLEAALLILVKRVD